MFRPLIAICAVALAGGLLPGRAQEKPAPPEEKPPRAQEPFRTGAHYVRVDAYPTRDGRPIPGLTAADDGKNDASTTKRFAMSWVRQYSSSTDVRGSRPKTAVPH